MRGPTTPTFDVIDVLACVGEERDRFHAASGAESSDARVIRAVLAARIVPEGAALAERASVESLVLTATVLRSLDALGRRMITLEELRRGFSVYDRATGGFAEFGPSRVWARTVGELLDSTDASEGRLRGQLDGVRKLLLESFHGQLQGYEGVAMGESAPILSAQPWPGMEQFRVLDDELVVELDTLVTECVDGPTNYPNGGIAAAAFVRGWVAVPVLETDCGDMLVRVSGALAAESLLQVRRARVPRFSASGLRLTINDHARPAWKIEPGAIELVLAAENRPPSLFTSGGRRRKFVILEHDDVVVVAGPIDLVQTICGASVDDAMATFRVELEAQYPHDDAPSELGNYERWYGRLLSRARRSQ